MSAIGEAAAEILAGHGALLRRVAPRKTGTVADACDALDAARARLRGGEDKAKEQLTLDLRATR